MGSSTKKNLQIGELTRYFTTASIGNWSKGTSQEFIVDCLEKMRIFEGVCKEEEKYSNLHKKSLLQNSLDSIKSFRDIRNMELMDQSKGKGSMTYDQYVSCAQNIASIFDRKDHYKRKCHNRMINNHDIESDIPHGTEYDDNDEVTEYLASKANHFQRGSRPSLKRDTWRSLSDSDK